MTRRLALALLAAGMLLGLLAPSAAASSFTIVQPTEKYASKTYGQWSAAWWQWAANISEPNSPVTDDTGADCAVNQKGPVWFLAGTTGGSAVTRSCTIPADKAILFPVINGECSTVEGDGTTEAELRACAKDLMDHVTATSASVDGTAIDLGPVSEGRFRFDSPLFPITFAPKNGFYPDGDVAGTGTSVADGFWVLVKPLAAGAHTVEFHATAPFPEFGITVEVDVHYDLTVSKKK
jgi:hypothetical protein